MAKSSNSIVRNTTLSVLEYSDGLAPGQPPCPTFSPTIPCCLHQFIKTHVVKIHSVLEFDKNLSPKYIYPKLESKVQKATLISSLSVSLFHSILFNPYKHWEEGGCCFPPPICFLPVTFSLLSKFPPNLVTFPKIKYRTRRKIKIFEISSKGHVT